MNENQLKTTDDIEQFLTYRGNTKLKRVGETIQFTEEQMKEYIHCSQDVFYFAEKYMKIVHLDDGLITIKLYPYQREMIESYVNNRFTICACARQSGKTTATTAYILWYVLFHTDKTVAILANKGDTAIEILSRVRLAYTDIPKFLQQGIPEGGFNKKSISLENGSRVIAEASGSGALRGFAINLLYLDETAHHEHWADFESSVLPTITAVKTTKVIMSSTPLGTNHFFEYWDKAQKGLNGYNPIMVTWKDVPGRDKAWYDQTLALMNYNMEKFDQEYNVEFLGSSGTLIAGWRLKELLNEYKSPLLQQAGISIYEQPIQQHKYTITCDVSEGKGLNYSTIQCIDVTKLPYNQVYVYRSNTTTPSEFAQIIYETARRYNGAQILVEFSSVGPLISEIIFDQMEYDGLLCTENNGAAGKKVSTLSKADKGLRQNQTVRRNSCSVLKLLVEQKQLVLNDWNSINELTTFSRKTDKTKWEAEPGKNDDLVLALAIFAWLTTTQWFAEWTDIQTIQQLRDNSVQELQDDMLIPLGIIEVESEEHVQARLSTIDPNNRILNDQVKSWIWDDIETLPDF